MSRITLHSHVLVSDRNKPTALSETQFEVINNKIYIISGSVISLVSLHASTHTSGSTDPIIIYQNQVIGLTSSISILETSASTNATAISTLSSSYYPFSSSVSISLSTLVTSCSTNATNITALSSSAVTAYIPKSLATAADQMLYSTAANTWASSTLTSGWRGILASTASATWDATNNVMTFGPNGSITGLIIRAVGSGTPDPVNAGAALILAGGANNFLKICTTGTGVGALDGLLIGINGTDILYLIRENYPQLFYSNGSIKMTIGQDGQPVTAHVGLAVTDLTANKTVYTTTSGRLTTTEPVAVAGLDYKRVFLLMGA